LNRAREVASVLPEWLVLWYIAGSDIPEYEGLIGKTVRIRRGPAAVSGDESHDDHCHESGVMGRYGE